MKTLVITMVYLVLLKGQCLAGLCDDVDFFADERPDKAMKIPKDTLFVSAQLPAVLYARVNRDDWYTKDQAHPSNVRGMRIDLNGDQTEEYFLANDLESNMHDSAYVIFSPVNGEWREVGSIESAPATMLLTGTIHGAKTWREFALIYRIGPNEYASAIYSYDGSKYDAMRGKVCEEGRVRGWNK